MNTQLINRLAALPNLAQIPKQELEWLEEHGSHGYYAAGSLVGPKGEQIEKLYIILSGRITIRVDRGAGPKMVTEWQTGQVIGILPYSRMVKSPGDTCVDEKVEFLSIHLKLFPEMIIQCPMFTAHTVHSMIDRVRIFNTSDLHDEKMISMGKLAAGLAHELNNPGAAILQTSNILAKRHEDVHQLMIALAQEGLDTKNIEVLKNQWHLITTKTKPEHSPLKLDQKREEFTKWLEMKNVENAWDFATIFANCGLDLKDLESFSNSVSSNILANALSWIGSNLEINRMMSEIKSAAENIVKLVSSMKNYSHMDQSVESKPTDIRKGFDNTLNLFAYKIRQKNITLKKEYQQNIPAIYGNAGELNQVWGNLIDNAIDATPPGGVIKIKINSTDTEVEVKVIDTGHGIPLEIIDRIFDPFYTTKGVGEGTGLGLDIAKRIIYRHGGQIQAASKPGCTEFLVMLPFITSNKN